MVDLARKYGYFVWLEAIISIVSQDSTASPRYSRQRVGLLQFGGYPPPDPTVARFNRAFNGGIVYHDYKVCCLPNSQN